MKTHQEIDKRSLAMARAIVEEIDSQPEHSGLEKARQVCHRWSARRDTPSVREWLRLLEKPWKDIRLVLLDESEKGQHLRQTDPFCGILTPRKRWEIYRSFRDRDKRGT